MLSAVGGSDSLCRVESHLLDVFMTSPVHYETELETHNTLHNTTKQNFLYKQKKQQMTESHVKLCARDVKVLFTSS